MVSVSSIIFQGYVSSNLIVTQGYLFNEETPPESPDPPDPDEESSFESDEDAELFAKAVTALEGVDSPGDLFDQIVEELES
jgi:hypothetical protein